MVNIKSSLSITSTSFFPTNASMGTSATEQFSGDADFQTVIIPANSTTVVFEPTGIGNVPGTAFLYLQAPASNASGFGIYLLGVAETPVLLATLLPKDFMCLPLAVTSEDIVIQATNLNGSESGTLNLFWAVR